MKWTKKQLDTLRRLWPQHSARHIAELVDHSHKAVKSKAKVLNLKHAPGYNRMKHSIVAVPQHVRDFIRKNYLKHTNKELATLAGVSRSTVLKVRREFNIQGKPNTGCYKKGSVPQNKGKKMPAGWSTPAMKRTQFKKGQQPVNTLKDGAITIRTDKSGRKYQWIRISVNYWRELHRVVYEKHHGKVPRGFNVVFKDGNSLNCTPSNLVAVDNRTLMEHNTIARFPAEVRETIHLVAKVKRKIKRHEKQD